MLASLWLPILLSSGAIFFASFLSWMILQFHAKDWIKADAEEDVMNFVREKSIPAGNYMFPCHTSPEEMKSAEFQKKYQEGPTGTLSVFPPWEPMGKKLGFTFLFYLAATFCIAYLSTLALGSGSDFMAVFRFVSTAAFLTHFAAVIPGCIWYRHRITGHFIDALVYAVLTGAIFGGLWPSA